MNRTTCRAPLIVAGLGTVLAVHSGCHTANSWADAGREQSSARRVVGVAPPARAGGPERLVVEYKDWGTAAPSKPFYMTVPLAADGRPEHPFGYAGDARDVPAAAAELPREQVRAVESATLPSFAPTRGDGATAPTQTVTYRGVGMPVSGSQVYAMVYRRGEGPMPAPPGYTADRAERAARVAAFREAQLRLSPGEHLVLLPYRQPRPRRRARAAAARAVLMTPVTLGMDVAEVVLAPVWLLTPG